MTIERVKDLADQITELQNEIYCNGNDSIASHKIKSSVRAYCPGNGQHFLVKELDIDMLPGCGCWSGINIILELDEDD